MARKMLRALQVEVTSRCTQRCAVCPRAVFGDRWHEGDLSEEHWESLRRDLERIEHLHLQGWGEPLLHPRIAQMARDGHAAGCRVGLTTNGELLSDATNWIVSGAVDVLAVSLAGGETWNRRLRDGGRPDEVLNAVERVSRARKRRHKPRIHIAFLLVRENAGDLAGTVRAAAMAGVDRIFVNHLDYVPTEELRERAAYTEGAVPQSVRAGLDEAKRIALELGVDLRLPITTPQEMLTCALDPRRMASVRWDGVVAPCVHLNLPIAGPIPRMTAMGPIRVNRCVYGCLDDAPLSEMLSGEARREFTAPFYRRCEADDKYREWGLLASGWGVVALADLDRAYERLGQELAQNPFPPACRGCPKVKGW
jgi:MoaA/NifB/PqqE/SkfB family radical SAM enzyme